MKHSLNQGPPTSRVICSKANIVIETKRTINVMHLNHPAAITPPVHGEVVSHETGPLCQKDWGMLV